MKELNRIKSDLCNNEFAVNICGRLVSQHNTYKGCIPTQSGVCIPKSELVYSRIWGWFLRGTNPLDYSFKH